MVTLNGRDVYLGPHGTKVSRIEYDRIIGEWLAGGRQLAAEIDSGITVVEIIGRFWKHAQGHYMKDGKATGTAENFKPALSLLKKYYGETAATKFGPVALKALRQRMVDAGGSRRYVNDNVARIRQVFRWAVSEQLIPVQVVQALATVSGLQKHRTEARESDPVLPVADEIVERTLPHLSSVVADMVRLQKLTGMRSGEVVQMRPCDIKRDGEVWEYRPQSHKTEHHGRGRVVLIGPQGQDVLRKYLLRESTAHCFQPREAIKERHERQAQNRKTPLSCGNRPGTNRKAKPKRTAGECYTNDSYRRAITRACDEAGIDRWHPHQLRHSSATAIRKDFGLEAAQVILGHAKPNVTLLYAERDLERAAEIMSKIG